LCVQLGIDEVEVTGGRIKNGDFLNNLDGMRNVFRRDPEGAPGGLGPSRA